jgi:HSP20 family protein
MELVRWEPFEGLSRLHSRINDLFDGNVGRARALPSATAGAWLPPVDILESNDAYLIRAELPGMKKEDFNLEVNDGSLTVSGERKPDGLSDGGVEYHRSERVHGRFSRSFYLSQTVRQDGIKATCRDGILEIHVLKIEEAKPRQIAISVN